MQIATDTILVRGLGSGVREIFRLNELPSRLCTRISNVAGLPTLSGRLRGFTRALPCWSMLTRVQQVLDRRDYSTLIPETHYSHFVSRENYRREVLTQCDGIA
jgi:hypothetical protein